ncbi:purine-cytosine permease [Lyophyllum atratum]|nr:purine-cytosine permease [Lyophyllum atratum]
MEPPSPSPSTVKSHEGFVDEPKNLSQKISSFLLHWGVETHGISPIPMEQRLDKRLYQMFFVWFSANFNILAFSTGSAGPVFFSLGLRDSLVIILVVDAVSCAVPAFFAVFGPKLGMRGMVQARFSWGFYGSVIPSILNVISMQGFLILNCIIGGQTLASVSDRLDDTAGIVIIGVLSLVVTFFGYKVVHWYESVAWIPNVVAFIVMLGIGGKHLTSSDYPSYPPPTASAVLSFVTFIASSVISWCTMTPDYGVYHNANASSRRIFIYTYLGFFCASITGHMLGAAFAAMAPAIPSWDAGFHDGSNVGGLIAAVLSPAGGFGKFLMVLISLSIPSACAPTMYTFGTSFMSIAPIFARIPRYVFVIVSEAILIPIAIIGAKRFYGTLVNVLSIIGYWSTAFAAIVLAEHFIFRRRDFLLYDLEDWDKPRRLPPGIAAVLSFAGAFGVIVPCMSQVWYVGPVARMGTGDVGVLTGFVGAGGMYVVLRGLERRVFSVGGRSR